MNKLWIFLLFLGGLAIGYFVKQTTTTGRDCCQVGDECNLNAPAGLTADFAQGSLKLNWQSVDSAEYYIVSIVNLSSPNPTPTILRKTAETAITITDSTFVANNNYRSIVSAVCKNCAISYRSASIDACLIVVEDLIEFTAPCLDAGCNCTNTTPVASPPNNSFTVGAAKQLHRISITCSGVTKWFMLQTENVGGRMEVKVSRPPNCGEKGSYDGPAENNELCGQLINSAPNYTINITQISSGGAIFTLSSGCTWTVHKCNGCNPSE